MIVQKYKLSVDRLYYNCIFSAVANAITNNKYPDLSYEQAWAKNTYTICEDGIRAAVSFFADNECVGAIHNVELRPSNGDDYISAFPENVRPVIVKEVFEYLLDDADGETQPQVTSVFWCKNDVLTFVSDSEDRIIEDIKCFYPRMSPFDDLLKCWTEYMGLNENETKLIKELSDQKFKDFDSRLIIDKQQIESVSNTTVNEECITSLNELNIVLNQQL